MSEEREWYEQLLDLQLSANREIWSRLEVGEEAGLRLTFVYLAPGEEEALRLAGFLRAQTDYELETRQRRKGWTESPEWVVAGVTQPADVTLEIIDAWVEWMVAAGAAEGPCAFDGWAPETDG